MDAVVAAANEATVGSAFPIVTGPGRPTPPGTSGSERHPMKVAVVSPSPVPFRRGGAERLFSGLTAPSSRRGTQRS